MKRCVVHTVLLAGLVAPTTGAVAQVPITVFLAGDSTMAEKLPSKRPETGWGELLQGHFGDGVRIENHAQNGRSTRTFIAERRWQTIVDALKPGDYVFIQFGHNDESKEKTDRYTAPEHYRENLAHFVAEVREKQAHPILLTPVMRRRFDERGHLQDTHGEYPDIVRRVAAEGRVPLIDMHRRSAEALERAEAEPSKKLFLHLGPGESANYPRGLEDDTHFSPAGAQLMAGLAVDEIRNLKLPLADHLKPPADDASTAGAGRRE